LLSTSLKLPFSEYTRPAFGRISGNFFCDKKQCVDSRG
jgi:hypothetical protein